MDAYLEEELLYDLVTHCVQNPRMSDFADKQGRVQEIGRELYANGGVIALENMFFSIEHRVKDEIGKDAKPYRRWWNGIG